MRPFPGLRPFGFEDREIFFGREDQVYSLYRLLEHSRFIAVVGSSGSGKSSLVRAGLLPIIEEESQGDGGRTWRFTTLHPGAAPLRALADAASSLVQESDEDAEIRRERTLFALRRSSFGLSKVLDEMPGMAGTSVLLVVDQFEELFRYAAHSSRDRAGSALWRDEATNFVQLLLEATRSRSSSVYVLITMRSDFIGDCSQFHGLPEAVSAAQFLVPSLTRDQREDVIRKPIEKVGAAIESTLVERLLNDAGSEIDQLPVLQHCLARLWDRAEARKSGDAPTHLGMADYRAIGRISGALSQHADLVMASLPDLELAVEQVFRALSEIDKEGRATRRALPFSQLLAETGVSKEDLLRVLDRFRADDCSFILPSPASVPALRDDSRIDVVHEALLRRWERISAEQTHVFDGKTRTGWLAAEDADGRFYRALLALLEAESAATVVTLPLDQVESRWEWWRSRPRTQAWAERYGGNLTRVEKLFGDSRAALAAERARQEEAERREREEERRKIEADEAAKRERLEHQAEVDRMRVESAQRLAHRTRIAAVAMCIIALLAVGSAVVALLARNQAIASDARSRQMATTAQNSLIAKAAAEQHAVVAQGIAETASKNAKHEAQVALQQKRVAVQQRAEAQTQQRQALSERSQVFLQVGRQSLLDGDYDNAAILLAAAYNGDSNNAVLQVLLRQALDKFSIRAGSIAAHGDLITALAFNPNGRDPEIATAGADGTAKLWSDSGTLLHVFKDQGDLITALAFDPTGRYLVTVGRDGSARLHDLRGITPASNPRLTRLIDVQDDIEGHAGRINSVVFSRSGKHILTAGSDGLVKIWNLAGGTLATQWVGAPKAGIAVNEAAFGANDAIVAACSADGTLSVWKAGTGAAIGSTTISSNSPLLKLAISPNGTEIAAGALDGTVVLYPLATKAPIEVHAQSGAINAITFDATGDRVLSASEDGTAIIVDAGTGDQVRSLPAKPGTPAVLTASYNPAGIGFETTYSDGSVNLWTREGDPIAVLSGHKGAALVAGFAPDGSLLATGGADGKVFFWHTPATLARADFAHQGAVDSIEFDRQGSQMLTASHDGTAALWQVGMQPQMVRLLRHAPGGAWVVAAHFSADGRRVVTAGGDQIKVWSAGSAADDPLANMRATAANKRFTQAAFVGDSYSVIAAQTDTSIENPSYKTNGWMVFSAGGRKVATQPGWQSGIRELAVSGDGQFVLAVSDSGYASFSTTDGRHGYTQWNSVAEGIPLGSQFAVGGVGGTIHIVDDKGDNESQWPSDDARVSAFAYSPQSDQLATGGTGGTLGAIWDLSRGGASHVVLQGGEGEVETAAFSPGDGTFLMATCSDGTVKIWDRESGDLIASEPVPASRATAAAFTPDGAAVVVGAQDGSVYYWPLRGGIPSPRAAAALVLRETDRSGLTDPLVSQAFIVLQKVPGSGR